MQKVQAEKIYVSTAVWDIVAVRDVRMLADGHRWKDLADFMSSGLANIKQDSRAEIQLHAFVAAFESSFREPCKAGEGAYSHNVERGTSLLEFVKFIKEDPTLAGTEALQVPLQEGSHFQDMWSLITAPPDALDADAVAKAERARTLLSSKDAVLRRPFAVLPLGTWCLEQVQTLVTKFYREAVPCAICATGYRIKHACA